MHTGDRSKIENKQQYQLSPKASLNKWVFRFVLKEQKDSESRTGRGREFQFFAAAYENARAPWRWRLK